MQSTGYPKEEYEAYNRHIRLTMEPSHIHSNLSHQDMTTDIKGPGALRQLEKRLVDMRDMLNSVRMKFADMADSLDGGIPEEDTEASKRPEEKCGGLLAQLGMTCACIQSEISRLDIIAQRIGRLL